MTNWISTSIQIEIKSISYVQLSHSRQNHSAQMDTYWRKSYLPWYYNTNFKMVWNIIKSTLSKFLFVYK